METTRFREYLQTQVDQGQLSEGTQRMYLAAIERFNEFLARGGEPTIEEMKDYLLARAADDGVSGSTLNVDKCALGKYLSLESRGSDYQNLKMWFSDNFRVSSGSTTDYFTDDELSAIRSAAAQDPRMEAIVAIFSRTGIRIGELQRLSVSDLSLDPDDPPEDDPHGGYITISREKRREEVRQRRSLTGEDVDIIRSYINSRGDYGAESAQSTSGLFFTQKLTPLSSTHIPDDVPPDVGDKTYRPTDSAIRNWIETLGEHTDHEDVTPARIHPHLFRHTVGTRLGKEGYSASQIGAYLGKASPAERYTNFGTESADRMAQSLR